MVRPCILVGYIFLTINRYCPHFSKEMYVVWYLCDQTVFTRMLEYVKRVYKIPSLLIHRLHRSQNNAGDEWGRARPLELFPHLSQSQLSWQQALPLVQFTVLERACELLLVFVQRPAVWLLSFVNYKIIQGLTPPWGPWDAGLLKSFVLDSIHHGEFPEDCWFQTGYT